MIFSKLSKGQICLSFDIKIAKRGSVFSLFSAEIISKRCMAVFFCHLKNKKMDFKFIIKANLSYNEANLSYTMANLSNTMANLSKTMANLSITMVNLSFTMANISNVMANISKKANPKRVKIFYPKT